MNILDTVMTVLAIGVAMVSIGHVLISKRDPKAAIGWIVVCVLVPVAGPFLYYLFGINRVRTRAQKLQRRSGSLQVAGSMTVQKQMIGAVTDVGSTNENPELVHISDTVTDRPLVGGNLIEVLHSGEQAYPAMLAAIENAERSLFLATYIFETDHTGRSFIDALSRAVRRGLDVKVMVDGLSDLFNLPRASRLLKKSGIPVVRFLPPRLIPPTVHLNLRNHRKILV
ncbi:MAG: PLDc N-terminal domain-containing protein, partial [Deltaproteobacteria bacterium]|nr:PLDc N-terminal domain-containing protein [Deltaproteobacteria bacterium]